MREPKTPEPGYYAWLTFNSPLSDARADRIARDLASTAPRTIADFGCGWGELLLRVSTVAPEAVGVGFDIDAKSLARGRTNAETRGLADRVRFVEADAASAADGTDSPADVAICVGSSHAFGGTEQALAALRRQVRPGGRLLFGESYWERTPTLEQASCFGSTPDELGQLADLVDLAISAGFRPLRIEWASPDEWAEFESGFLADWEDWLLRYGDHPEAEETAEQERRHADEHRNQWLRGYRDILGFAYLTLGVPKPVAGE